MSISIVKQGIMDSFQDTGRYGYQHIGINPGGAVDRYAARVVNALVGNSWDEAVLELHFPAAQILFEYDALIALGGADWQPMLNDKPVSLWQPVFVRRNTILQFPQGKSGMRCYMALAGGWDTESWLGSNSTHQLVGKGGLKGRKLMTDDKIEYREYHLNWISRVHDEQIMLPLPWKANPGQMYSNPQTLFFIKGKEWEELTETSRYAISSQSFLVRPASDRMGYQLEGPALKRTNQDEMLPSAVSSGTIQLLPSGQLIILAADHQTTGVYPRIGHIISAHLPKFAQLRPGQAVRFHPADISVAEKLLYTMEQDLHVLTAACEDHLKPYI